MTTGFLFQSNPEVVLKIEVFSLELHRLVRKRERIHEMQNFIEKKCQYMGRQFTIEEKKEPKEDKQF